MSWLDSFVLPDQPDLSTIRSGTTEALPLFDAPDLPDLPDKKTDECRRDDKQALAELEELLARHVTDGMRLHFHQTAPPLFSLDTPANISAETRARAWRLFHMAVDAIAAEAVRLAEPSRTMSRTETTLSTCRNCRGRDFWRNAGGVPICRRCYPPAPGVEAWLIARQAV